MMGDNVNISRGKTLTIPIIASTSFEAKYFSKLAAQNRKMRIGAGHEFLEADIKELYVPLKVQVISENANSFIHKNDSAVIAIDEFIRMNKKIVLIGEHGSGKSVLVQYLNSMIVEQSDEIINFGCKKGTMVFNVPLSSYSAQSMPIIDFIADTLQKEYSSSDDIKAFINSKIFSRQALFIFDGFDNVPDNKRADVLAKINAFAENDKSNTFIITARVYKRAYGYSKTFKIGKIQNLDAQDIKKFTKAVFGMLGQSEEDAQANASKFLSHVNKSEGLIQLAINPLFLSVLSLLFGKNYALPKRRIELYKIYVGDIVSALTGKGEQIEYNIVERVFAYIAFEMRKRSASGESVTEAVLKQLIKRFYESNASRKSLEALGEAQKFFNEYIRKSGLFTVDGESLIYTFSQSAIEEYLAALHICFDLEYYGEGERVSRERYKEIIDMFIGVPIWKNIFRLVVEYIATINMSICNIMDIVVYLTDLDEKIAIDGFGENILTAGDCLKNLINTADERYAEYKSRCISKLLSILNSNIYPIDNRIEAGRLLSYMGDTRFADYIEVPEMVLIKAGQCVIGAKEGTISAIIEDSKKVILPPDSEWIHNYWKVTLESEIENKKKTTFGKSFKMSKYPITNQQYSCFIQQNPKYPIPGGGSDEKGLVYTWDKEKRSCQLAYSNCPVVLISWNDATEYCKWLSKKTGRKFRLPTEEEWEYAARGEKSYVYPWGNEWKDATCNTFEIGKNDILPVGCFTEGASSFGLCDCAGQVWEWTQTTDNELWEKSWPESLKQGGKQAYIVKGGAWDDISVFARCSARGPNASDFSEHYIGFRILEELQND